MNAADIREDEVYARDDYYPFVRRVLALTMDGMVHYEEYYRDTAERFSTNRLCSVGTFARWSALPCPGPTNRDSRWLKPTPRTAEHPVPCQPPSRPWRFRQRPTRNWSESCSGGASWSGWSGANATNR
jgi:hypothetical protein